MRACLCGQESRRPSGWCGRCAPQLRLREVLRLEGRERERHLAILTDAATALPREPGEDDDRPMPAPQHGAPTPPSHWNDDEGE